MDLDQLDAEHGGRMVVGTKGRTFTLPAAADLGWEDLVTVASNANFFIRLVWPPEEPIEAWKIDGVQQAWLAHNGLPEVDQMRRLIYMLERYGAGIEPDLRIHYRMSLGELWRSRQWRELLGLIDHLPPNSHMNQLLMNDEEHLRSALQRQKRGGTGASSMSEWSTTNSMLATLIDAVNRNSVITQAVSSSGGSKPSYEPYPRPATALDKIRNDLERERHENMNSILLRDRD